MKVRIIHSNQHISFTSAALTFRKLTRLRWSQALLVTFQVFILKSTVTSLMINISITVLTRPLTIFNVNSTSAVLKVATAPFIKLTWFFSISPFKLNYGAISTFRYVCVLPSSNRPFMIKLLIPFSATIGTAWVEIHSSFWHSVAINALFWCSFRPWGIFVINVMDSALSHLSGRNRVTFYCAFPKSHLCCKLTSKCILQLYSLLPSSTNATHEFQQSPILYSYFTMPHFQTLSLFFTNLEAS